MQFKFLALSTLLGAAYAQSTQSLNQTLTSNNMTTDLASLLGQFPNLAASLSTLTNVTLLAPSNQALGAFLNTSTGQELAADIGLLQAVLQYHVLQGTYESSAITNMSSFIPTALTNMTYTNVTGGQRVEAILRGSNVDFIGGLLQNVSVVQANLSFSGGVIHVIDGVLTLPQNVSSTLINAGLSSAFGALNDTGILKTANGLGNVTIFAPDNSAFQEIASGLTNMSMSELVQILEYHAIISEEPLYSSSLMNGSSVATLLQDNNVTITVTSGGDVFVNDAKVVTPNILIAGGVIHVIDEVLNPNNTTPANGTATAGSPAFSGASSGSAAPFTSGVPSATSNVGATASTIAPAASSTSSKAAAAALVMPTGAIGAAALFGAGAAWVNL